MESIKVKKVQSRVLFTCDSFHPETPEKIGLLATYAQSLLSCARSVFERLATNNKIIILGIYVLCLHVGESSPSHSRTT